MKPIKICAKCARPMEWRKRWAKNWNEVKYCSERCRKEKKKKTASHQPTEKSE
jgi:hypothetical protein